MDALGLLCPLPILRLAAAVKRAAPGDLIELVGDDEGLLDDLPAWCEGEGHELLSMVLERRSVCRADGSVVQGLIDVVPDARRKGWGPFGASGAADSAPGRRRRGGSKPVGALETAGRIVGRVRKRRA